MRKSVLLTAAMLFMLLCTAATPALANRTAQGDVEQCFEWAQDGECAQRQTPASLRVWERRIAEAKKKHNPKLKDWAEDLFGTPGSDNHALFHGLRNAPEPPISEIIHIDSSTLSLHNFLDYFERPGVPVLLLNLPQQGRTQDADNATAWPLSSFEVLANTYGKCSFKVGEDDDGRRVRVKLEHFITYLQSGSMQDDSPFYVFDSTFDDDKLARALLSDYSVPRFFPHDLFGLVDARQRPPHRWFLVGPQRSGSTVHIDPLDTSAWNALTHGRKRWVLFPPGTPKRIAQALDVIRQGEGDEAIHYFTLHLPRLRRLQQEWGHNFTMLEFTQHAGETVFVPGGWWHAVLNLDDSIAVTQNFCSPNNFVQVWRRTRSERRNIAGQWLEQLQRYHPSLARAAVRANREDGFVMGGKGGRNRKGGDKREREREKERERERESQRKNQEQEQRQRQEQQQSRSQATAARTKSKHASEAEMEEMNKVAWARAIAMEKEWARARERHRERERERERVQRDGDRRNRGQGQERVEEGHEEKVEGKQGDKEEEEDDEEENEENEEDESESSREG